MSVSNLLVPNNLSIYAGEITADTVNVNNLDVDNLDVTDITAENITATTLLTSTTASTLTNTQMLGATSIDGDSCIIVPDTLSISTIGEDISITCSNLMIDAVVSMPTMQCATATISANANISIPKITNLATLADSYGASKVYDLDSYSKSIFTITNCATISGNSRVVYEFENAPTSNFMPIVQCHTNSDSIHGAFICQVINLNMANDSLEVSIRNSSSGDWSGSGNQSMILSFLFI